MCIKEIYRAILQFDTWLKHFLSLYYCRCLSPDELSQINHIDCHYALQCLQLKEKYYIEYMNTILNTIRCSLLNIRILYQIWPILWCLLWDFGVSLTCWHITMCSFWHSLKQNKTVFTHKTKNNSPKEATTGMRHH